MPGKKKSKKSRYFWRQPLDMTEKRPIFPTKAAMQWGDAQQRGLSQRILRQDAPLTRRDASNLMQAIQAVFLSQLDLEVFRRQLAYCQAHLADLNRYYRRVVADVAAKVAARGKLDLTMGLVCKVSEAAAMIGG